MYSETQIFLIYAGLFFAAMMFSLLINSLFMRFARTLGVRDYENMVRWSATAKPAFGGIGFFILFLVSFATYGALFPMHNDALRPELLGLLASTALGFLVGLADDAYNTRPLLKFLAQIACGVIIVGTGTSIHLFDDPLWNTLLTIFWVVGLMNSINMLDNMDGITTIVSIFILMCGITTFLVSGDLENVHLVLMVGTVAALSGFLFFNWNPSSMFMGDTGSQFLGVFLAYVGIRCFWNMPSPLGEIEPWRQATCTLVVFLLPIADTTTVTINRLMRGRSPFIGGRDHTTHHLSYTGLTDGQVGLIFGGLCAMGLLLTFVIVRFVPQWERIHSVLFGTYAVMVFIILFILTKRTKPPTEE